MDSETKVVEHDAIVVNASEAIPPAYTVQPTAVIHTQTTTTPTIIVARQLGPKPTSITCESCHAEVITRTDPKPSTKTHLFAFGLCVFMCWCCVCIPYCIDNCKNINHYCPNCNSYIGVYKA